MTLDEFKSVAKAINALYGSSTKVIFDTREKVEMWYSCLSDLDYSAVSAAVKNHAMTSKFAPTIAEIRQECVTICTPETLNEQAAWDMVRDGIRNGTYGAVDEYNKFPEVIQRAVGSPSSLTEWAALESSEVETVVQSLFKRAYRAEVERQSRANVLGAIGAQAGSMARLAESVADRLESKT